MEAIRERLVMDFGGVDLALYVGQAVIHRRDQHLHPAGLPVAGAIAAAADRALCRTPAPP